MLVQCSRRRAQRSQAITSSWRTFKARATILPWLHQLSRAQLSHQLVRRAIRFESESFGSVSQAGADPPCRDRDEEAQGARDKSFPKEPSDRGEQCRFITPAAGKRVDDADHRTEQAEQGSRGHYYRQPVDSAPQPVMARDGGEFRSAADGFENLPVRATAGH